MTYRKKWTRWKRKLIKIIRSLLTPILGVSAIGAIAAASTSCSNEHTVKGVTLNKSDLRLYTNKTEQLIATVTPENASNKKVTWESSNPNIAIVDENGVVTAVVWEKQLLL